MGGSFAMESVADFRRNTHKQDKLTKLGVKNKRLKAGWDDDYRANLLLSA